MIRLLQAPGGRFRYIALHKLKDWLLELSPGAVQSCKAMQRVLCDDCQRPWSQNCPVLRGLVSCGRHVASCRG